MSVAATKYLHRLEDGRVKCGVCRRACRLRDGSAGCCFVRAREGDAVVLTTYGRPSAFCVDPVERKPLNHFVPGTSVLSFGTAGCNLCCRLCQNWDIFEVARVRQTQISGSRAWSDVKAWSCCR
jgi:pyruvate formate lyase activating enzyme